ncbi:glycosyltransferase family 1 protein [Anaerocolumna sp. AGMB13020]|uniref:glycosyltransferase family 1 protein n=1 Tax=Anaerocolumna sp. AGMB13020 TaxID=3081750 RepID=UPI0029559248|nr:glycosyltransferase family 1 protein [Anaerocolumna sp. AGMB13020]WOO38555.1 glycosyltransferase family 1 protein [Anaerocolumna sp. AGMB13020]
MVNKWKSILKIKVKGILHSVQAKTEKRLVNYRIANYDVSVISNNKPEKIKRILFVVERMAKYSGGQTSMLRLGTELAKLGHEVGYVVYKPQSKSDMEEIAASNLTGYLGKMYTNKQLEDIKSDIVVATSWDTVAFAKRIPGYKMYFIQDYEPYFFSFGELFLMAKKTYEQGLHMVSLGAWNKEMIEKNCQPVSPVDFVEFPYESAEYPHYKRDYDSYGKKKEIVVAVYLKYYGKRLPNITQHMLKQVKEKFLSDGIKLTLLYYGEDKSFRTEGGENLGMLTKKELLSLYRRADFGMVASMSNVSLVPYEMLATGLPLIEFEDGTFPYFFPEDSALLTSLDAEDLYVKLKESIKNPSLLKERDKNAVSCLSTLSWSKTAKQFEDILNRLEGV